MNFKRLLSILCLSGCSALGLFSPTTAPLVSRPTQYLPGSFYDTSITNGLSNVDRSIYYHMDEGIQYLPTNVLLSLKRSDPSSIVKVMDELLLAHPERFGLLPDYSVPNNSLPLGITQSDETGYVPMSGIACPTCHTSLISNANNQFFLVDGASSRFSIEIFLGGIIKSLVGTLANPVEFEAFYQRYATRAIYADTQTPLHSSAQTVANALPASLTSGDTTKLEAAAQAMPNTAKGRSTSLQYDAYPTSEQLSTRTGMYFYLVRRFLWLFGQTKYGTNTVPNMSASGFGRSNPWTPTAKMLVDKFLHQDISAVETATIVNTPYVWDFDRQHLIFIMGQTNSLVERSLAQGLALLSDFNSTTYETTVSIKKLQAITQYGQKIHAPSWPENILGPIDRSLASQGKGLFKAQCLSCHDPKSSNTTIASATYNYVNVGTDNTYYGVQREALYGKDLLTGIIAPFMTKVKQAAMQVEGITLIEMQNTYEAGRLPAIWQDPTVSNAFEAKPLAGVWATPPFLHNGSVKSIYELLLPANQRSTSFRISSYVYDTQHLGYMDDQTLPEVDTFTLTTNCATCLGNDNGGHEYGVMLSETDKMALIEFLKSYDATTTF